MLSWSTITIVMSSLWVYIKPILLILLNEVKDELLELALSVVTSLKDSDLSSSEKREAAFEAIKEKALETGEEISDSTINLVLELAVSKLKSEE